MNPISEYLYRKEILKEDLDLSELKSQISDTKQVKIILDRQYDDGTWGDFHSMNTSNTNKYTTEKAIRRLINLGFGKEDEVLYKTIDHMKAFMSGQVALRDCVEKKHDWDLLTQLFVATWLEKLAVEDSGKDKMIEKWTEIVSEAFDNKGYSFDRYVKIYDHVMCGTPGKSKWFTENFYVVSLLAGKLSKEVSRNFANHLLNNEKGIYYIHPGPLEGFPTNLKTKQMVRHIHAMSLVKGIDPNNPVFDLYKQHLETFRDNDGFWDFSGKGKDGMNLPYAENWRKQLDRKLDSTLYVLRFLNT